MGSEWRPNSSAQFILDASWPMADVILQMFHCSQVLWVLNLIYEFRWSEGSIVGKDQFLHESSMGLGVLCLISKTCPEHGVGDRTQMHWFCFHLWVTACMVLSSAGELDFIAASALACATRGPHSSLLWATKCLCVSHTPVREEGRSFLDDNGRSTVQDEGRVCDITTKRVRVAFLHQFQGKIFYSIAIKRKSTDGEVLFIVKSNGSWNQQGSGKVRSTCDHTIARFWKFCR